MRQGTLVSNGSFPFTTDKPVGVMMASTAVARFERLVDRINLYCLSEIDACLTEKESLTFMVGVDDVSPSFADWYHMPATLGNG